MGVLNMLERREHYFTENGRSKKYRLGPPIKLKLKSPVFLLIQRETVEEMIKLEVLVNTKSEYDSNVRARIVILHEFC